MQFRLSFTETTLLLFYYYIDSLRIDKKDYEEHQFFIYTF